MNTSIFLIMVQILGAKIHFFSKFGAFKNI